MKKFFNFLLTNQLVYTIGMLFVYAFYGAVFGISLFPSAFILYKLFNILDLSNRLDSEIESKIKRV